MTILSLTEAAEAEWLEANAVQVELFCAACDREWRSWSYQGEAEEPDCPDCGELGVAL
jgi:hypothetical protein